MDILIIDDSTFSQRILGNLIAKNLDDVNTYFAKDGEEGLEKYKEIKPDYTFVDLLMPKLNGEQLIKLINEYDPNAKLIVVSADVQKSIKEEVNSYGVMAFINKPITEEKAKYICEMIRNDKDEG
ncbi:Chemotaxis protein CheY [Clostridium liquoris]|jgi:two-component system chemotaxis response regulator CheY|uniref:Stage 0 sporulation protein A homolog n=1 Tax=Clostridium liquoris TaxID=1289519 RepID=A0A2T0B5G4_9CLOT|nr:response regulator [Clostridium liquoris]PRR79053.1 Chemotaxis protein CheY [Clostridium liquoris]